MKTSREHIQQTTNEGALRHRGLYWIDPNGKSFLVNQVDDNSSLSHEEWANKNGYSLEEMLDGGWIRVQAISPLYLMIDHNTSRLGKPQVDALYPFFAERYNRMILERANNMLYELDRSPSFVSEDEKEHGFDFITGRRVS